VPNKCGSSVLSYGRSRVSDRGTLQSDWTVLLIGDVSGAGKTVVARQLGLEFGVSWLHVDDLRLALQHSGAALPEAGDTYVHAP